MKIRQCPLFVRTSQVWTVGAYSRVRLNAHILTLAGLIVAAWALGACYPLVHMHHTYPPMYVYHSLQNVYVNLNYCVYSFYGVQQTIAKLNCKMAGSQLTVGGQLYRKYDTLCKYIHAKSTLSAGKSDIVRSC